MSDARQRPETVGGLGEFPLIERLTRRLPGLRRDVVLGVGDDVAAFRVADDRLVLATCDCQVAGRHFLPERVDPFRLGRKCAAINLSDIASVGGTPTHFLVSLILPDGAQVGFLEALYDGLSEEAARFETDVIGGNVSGGECLAIDLALLGEVHPDRLVRRSGARPGDRVLVCGELGAAATGLALVLADDRRDEPATREARDAFETPRARVREARALGDAGGPSAMIDVSDGLSADLGHLCDESGVGVRIELSRLPVAGSAEALAASIDRRPLDLALGGGEDYALLFTAPEARVAALQAALEGVGGRGATEIGRIVPAEEGRVAVDRDGVTGDLGRAGWRHFGS